METKKLFGIIGISCAGVGFLLSFIFTFISCSSSAKHVANGKFNGSLLYIVVAIGAVLAIAGAVLAFLSLEKGEKPGIIALCTFALVVVTIIFATIPHFTICAYNCSMKSAFEDSVKGALSSYSSFFN